MFYVLNSILLANYLWYSISISDIKIWLVLNWYCDEKLKLIINNDETVLLERMTLITQDIWKKQ